MKRIILLICFVLSIHGVEYVALASDAGPSAPEVAEVNDTASVTADVAPVSKGLPDDSSWIMGFFDDLAAAWARGEGLPIIIAMVMFLVWACRALGKRYEDAKGWKHKVTAWTLTNIGGWALNAFWSGLMTVWMQWQSGIDLSWRTALWGVLTASMTAGFHTFNKDRKKAG